MKKPVKKPAPVKKAIPPKKPEPAPVPVKPKKFGATISVEDHARLLRFQKKTGFNQAKLLHEFIELYGKTHRIK